MRDQLINLKSVHISVVIFIALAIRLFFVIIHVEFGPIPPGGADEVRFERIAWELAISESVDIRDYLSNSYFLTYLASRLYSIIGRVPAVLHVVMACLGSLLVYITYRVTLTTWADKGTATIAAWSVALFPQLVAHSVVFLRETPIALAITLTALSLAKYYRRPSLQNIFSAAFWIIVATLFHSGMLFALPAVLVAVAIWPPSKTQGSPSQKALLTLSAIGITVIGFLFVQIAGIGLGKFGGSLDGLGDRLLASEEINPRGGAAYPTWLQLANSPRDILTAPLRVLSLLTAPIFPPIAKTTSHLLGVFDAFLYILILIQLFRMAPRIRESPILKALLLVAFFLTIVYAFGTTNFGTAIRHRAKFVPLLLVITAGAPGIRFVLNSSNTARLRKTPPR